MTRRIPFNPVRSSPAFERQQQFRVPFIDERRLSFSYPSFGADPELAPPTTPPATTPPEAEPPPPVPSQVRGIFAQRRQERERGGDQAGPPDTHGAAAGETDDFGEFGKSVAFGLGMTSGLGALGTMGALGAGLAAGVDPRDIGVVSALESLHADPEPDVAEPAPEPEPAAAPAPAAGTPGAAGGGGGGGPDLSVGGRGGYGGRGFADTPAAMGDPGAQSAPGGVGRTGDPIGGGGFGGGAVAGAGGSRGVGGYGSSGRGASDPGVAGVAGGVSGRGAGGRRGHGDNARSSGFGRGGSTGSQFGGGGRETGIGGGGHGEGAGSGSCFISSATVDAFGWPDNCGSLQLLRWWRDHVLRPVPGGEQAVEFYYDCAPQIVRAINARPNSAAIYAMIWRRFLRPFIAAVASGRNRRAFVIYLTMIEALRRSFR